MPTFICHLKFTYYNVFPWAAKLKGVDGPEKKVCGVFLVSSEQCSTNL